MGLEIERKFLVTSEEWKAYGPGARIQQGYLAGGHGCLVRVRTMDDQAFLTIKGPTTGFVRAEYEYPIPYEDAVQLLETLAEHPIIEKHRIRVPHAGLVWEVDVFSGLNTGLVVAEVELEREDQPVNLPSWVGAEVSHDPHYRNAYLTRHPYSQWQEEQE